jgi:hypothetical protein
MLLVVLLLVGLFLIGFCLVALPRGVGQIVAGVALLVMSATIAARPGPVVPPAAPATPASQPSPSSGQTFTMQVSHP